MKRRDFIKKIPLLGVTSFFGYKEVMKKPVEKFDEEKADEYVGDSLQKEHVTNILRDIHYLKQKVGVSI
jgi:hypothetical protein|tara:strand:- start:176 stop:382 length:207 start_codon:yes stop_codon:yes gene_type:complete